MGIQNIIYNIIGYVAILNRLWESIPPAGGIGASSLLGNSAAEQRQYISRREADATAH